MLFAQRQEVLSQCERMGIEKVPRVRRRMQDVQGSKFPCPFKDCYKQYSSKVSLSLHMRQKHDAGKNS